MRDLLSALDDAMAGLGEPGTPDFPGVEGSFPGEFPGGEIEQTFGSEHISRSSRLSRKENGASEKTDEIGARNDFAPGACAHTSYCVETPGNPGKPGNGEERPAGTGTYDFLVPLSLPGKNDENREIRASFPGDALPIAPGEVRSGVERELRALAEDGRDGPDALRDAVEITRAKIRNSEALAEHQAHAGRCHVCDAPLDDAAPVVAVLSWSRGKALHMHAGCHDAYQARRAVLVDRIMRAAGYGAEVEGSAT